MNSVKTIHPIDGMAHLLEVAGSIDWSKMCEAGLVEVPIGTFVKEITQRYMDICGVPINCNPGTIPCPRGFSLFSNERIGLISSAAIILHEVSENRDNFFEEISSLTKSGLRPLNASAAKYFQSYPNHLPPSIREHQSITDGAVIFPGTIFVGPKGGKLISSLSSNCRLRFDSVRVALSLRGSFGEGRGWAHSNRSVIACVPVD